MTRASEQVGRSGEYLACSVLAQISDTVTLVPHGAEADIICGCENQLYKVQVKTATSELLKISKSKIKYKYRSGWTFDCRRGANTKNRRYEDGAIDIFAFVILPLNKVIFTPYNSKKTKYTFTNKEINNINSIDTLKECFDFLGKQLANNQKNKTKNK